jgi:hypothetical protein
MDGIADIECSIAVIPPEKAKAYRLRNTLFPMCIYTLEVIFIKKRRMLKPKSNQFLKHI